MHSQNFTQLLWELMLNQRIKETAIKKQISVPRSFFILLAVISGIRGCQVQDDANFPRQFLFTIHLHRFRVGQHNIERNLCRKLTVFFARVMEVIEITAFNRHNRLIKGYPVFHLMAKQFKRCSSKAGKEFCYV